MGCNKQESFNNENFTGNKLTGVKSEVTFDAPLNKSNPYDALGQVHNEGLAAIHDYKIKTGDTTRRGKTSFLEKWYHERTGIGVNVSSYPRIERTIMQDYKKVLDNLMESPEGKGYMTLLCNTLEATKEVTPFAYNRLLKSIIAIEQKIVSSALGEYEHGVLLHVSTMMRHSAHYWSNYLSNPEITKKQQDKAVTNFLRKLAGLIAGVGADVSALAWHYAKNSPYDVMVVESIMMSEICGYYTGWW
ncbi:hypothetical protein OKW96_16510 [Sphingobacterium sp. KU25419]|nr:hypothetical protein OKW96_16510 [Sphingobacterium sp. KU25419]